MKRRRSIHLTLLVAAAALSVSPAMAHMDDPASHPVATPAEDDSNMVMYLGNVAVHGQKQITETLQAIKIGLEMPLSTDPKLADVVVCRLEKKVGTHIQETLICGTNRNLARQRYDLGTQMDLAAAHSGPLADTGLLGVCSSGDCYSEQFGTMNAFIDGMPKHYLYTAVDGTAFRKLLKQVPLPAPKATAAPAAATGH